MTDDDLGRPLAAEPVREPQRPPSAALTGPQEPDHLDPSVITLASLSAQLGDVYRLLGAILQQLDGRTRHPGNPPLQHRTPYD